MPVSITGRHVQVDEKIEDYIQKKIPRFEKYTDKLQKLDVVVQKDGYNHKAEMRLKAGPIEVNANMKDPDLMRAIDMLADKVERQLQKKWEKLRKNKKHVPEAPRKAIARAAIAPEVAPPPKSARKVAREQQALPSGRDLPIYLESLGVRIFPARRCSPNPMSVDAAAEELYFKDENFLCFVNEEDRQLNVLYRRKDGNFGLIEPVLK